MGQSGHVFSTYGLSFVFGNDWDVSRNIYHGGALLFGTIVTSIIALIIGVPIAVASAVFISELCPRRLRGSLTILVDLLAAVPSVVYGLWGVFVLAPRLLPAEKWFASTFSFIPWIGGGIPTLYNYFIAGLILAIMILPIVSAISREVIATVPSEHKEAALALGATRWEMIRMAVLPYSRPGITGGAMLGMGRAIGETIAVVLVIGSAPKIGSHLFAQGYTLAAVIANEFGEVDGDPHLGAVRGRVGAVRAHADREHHRALVHLPGLARHQGNGRHRHDDRLRPGEREMSTTAIPQISARRRRTDKVMRGSLFAATMVALIPLILIIYYLLRKGLSAWTQSGFFTTDPTGSFFGSPGGIRSAILGSLEIVALATLISIPIGIGVALYLTEYGKESWFANTVRYFVDVMTGVPSIMFGLFVYIVLVIGRFGGSGFAAWKGAVAVSLLMLPIVIRSSEVVLLLVPSSLREAALALGAQRWRVVFRVVLPTAAPGLLTGSLLAIARGMGETAPLLFTVSTAFALTFSLSQQMNTMPFLIYNDITSPRAALQTIAWGTALTLVVIVLILNLVARLIASRSRMA